VIFKSFRRDSTKIMGERSSSLDLARGRLVLISGVFMLCYMLIAARVIDLTIIQGEFGAARATVEEAAPGPVSALPRGIIYDRNGILLAATIKMASLYADPALISDPAKTAQGLHEIFPSQSYDELLKKLQSDKRFVWIRRNLTPEEQYAVLDLGQPGLNFERENRRIYPQGSLAAHLVGFTGVDNQGLGGIERSFDETLKEGEALTLTLDVRLQHVLRREIARAVKEFSAIAGTGVIMDVNTGEVLAGVSLPDFDPHDAGGADDNEIFNRLTLGTYELGSMFKIFSTAALLEIRDPPMGMTFDATEPLKAGRFTINDYHAEDRVLTIPEVFMFSSNIGSALMGKMVGTQELKEFYGDLGLLDPVDFSIKEIGAPLLPNPWNDVSTLTISYGHGLSTTPLQMTAATATIVNGGSFIRPKLVMSRRDLAGRDIPLEEKDKKAKRVLSEQTAHRMRQLMRLVVTDGTGGSAEVPGYRVGGKTGTAEKTGGKRGYDTKRQLSSFVGVFPIEAPKYAILVMVDEPKGNKKSFGYATGGWVAAPAVARIITSMGAILGLPAQQPSSQEDIAAPLQQYVHKKEDKEEGGGNTLVSY
jgi:cell division protein FtsI (penicillin-binding protein 3)